MYLNEICMKKYILIASLLFSSFLWADDDTKGSAERQNDCIELLSVVTLFYKQLPFTIEEDCATRLKTNIQWELEGKLQYVVEKEYCSFLGVHGETPVGCIPNLLPNAVTVIQILAAVDVKTSDVLTVMGMLRKLGVKEIMLEALSSE